MGAELNIPDSNNGRAKVHTLSPLNVLALSFGCIIGWGSYIMPGTVFLPSAGILGTTLAVLIGCVLFLFIGRSFAYMMEILPNNGGSFSFVSQVLGKNHAFLTIWALGFAYISLLWVNTNNFAPFTRYMFGDVLKWGFNYQIGGFDIFLGEALMELGILVLFGLLVCFAKRLTIALQTVFFILLLVCVSILAVGVCLNTDLSTVFTTGFVPDSPRLLQVYNILLFAPWMYIGFGCVTYASGEFRFPIRKMRYIISLAIILGALDYCVLNAVAATAVPPQFSSNAEYIAHLGELSGIEGFPVLYSVSTKLGTMGVVLLGIAIFCALTSSLIGFYRALGNMIKPMADSGFMPKWFSRCSQDGIPRRAVALIMFVSLPMPFVGRTAVTWLTDATSISSTLAYAYISYCCILLARKRGDRRHQQLGFVGFVTSLTLFLLPLLTSMFFEHVFDIESYFLLAIWAIGGYVLTEYFSEHGT